MAELKFVTTPDGMRYALKSANTQQPAVLIVLVHGVGTSCEYWTELIGQLPDAWHVVAPDVPGSGYSRAVEGDLEIAKVSSVLLETLQQALGGQTGEIVLVGHSLGALVVLEMARQRPQFSDLLVLVDPVLYRAEDVLTRFHKFVKMWRYSIVVLSQFAGVLLSGRISAVILRSRLARKILLPAQLGRGPDVGASTLEVCLKGTRGWPHFRIIPVIRAARRVQLSKTIKSVSSRIALVRGSLDPLTNDDEVRRLATECKLVSNRLIELAGHSPMLNMPKELAAAVEAIVDEHIEGLE